MFTIHNNYLSNSISYHDNLDFNLLNNNNNNNHININSMSLEQAIISLNMDILDKHMFIKFCNESKHIKCINDEITIMKKINQYICDQIYINVNDYQNVNILKSLFLQNHIKLYEDS
ncbi:hypothetical protein PFFCH_01319 [Plasmodium falciparum FCH/4]|nr:hypothetical protein PFFVO_01998 [Plasmodium falciparum Vietnam Oak-Knoll (FVO)]ETW31299.1 hypothetical protein PFFCH_01319 [Plasmodium falciparum FCH/4]